MALPHDRVELAKEVDDGLVDDEGASSGLSREVLAWRCHALDRPQRRVRLGLNQNVPLGALAASHAQPTPAFRRAAREHVWTMALAARPFVALGELGGACCSAAAWASVTTPRCICRPSSIRSRSPQSNRSRAAARERAVIASYDSRFFEMGLGFGAQTVNDTNRAVPSGSA